jgi:hypothetical protein
MPTPLGVPVRMIVPGKSVAPRDKSAISVATGKIIWLVLASCIV